MLVYIVGFKMSPYCVCVCVCVCVRMRACVRALKINLIKKLIFTVTLDQFNAF